MTIGKLCSAIAISCLAVAFWACDAQCADQANDNVPTAPTQILPPAAPAADGFVPSDKDAFTKLYAEALTKALPDLQIAVAGPLRVTIHVPNLGSHVDGLDDIYGLCERHKFACGDELSEWLTLDTSNVLRQLDAARGNPH